MSRKGATMKNSKILNLLVLLSLTLLMACGSDDDDGDTTVILNDTPQFQREEGPVSTQPDVRTNVVVNNTVKVVNRNWVVEEDDLVVDCDVQEAQPDVIHQQVIYVAPNCSAVQNAEAGDDQILDRTEVESQIGTPVASLETREGPTFTVNDRVPLSQLPAQAEDFVFVVYSQDNQGINIPIVCMPFQVQIVENDSSETAQPDPETENSEDTEGTTL